MLGPGVRLNTCTTYMTYITYISHQQIRNIVKVKTKNRLEKDVKGR